MPGVSVASRRSRCVCRRFGLTLFDAVGTCQKRNVLCDTRVRFAGTALGIMVGVVATGGRDR